MYPQPRSIDRVKEVISESYNRGNAQYHILFDILG